MVMRHENHLTVSSSIFSLIIETDDSLSQAMGQSIWIAKLKAQYMALCVVAKQPPFMDVYEVGVIHVVVDHPR